MLFDFKACKERYGSPYQIEKAIRSGALHKMDVGVYSDTGAESEVEVLQAKYPATIVSFDSAYFYYDMTDYIPETYTLVTGNHAKPIKDDRIRQFYVPENVLDVGKTIIEYEDAKIRIYDKERLLIETARMKNRLPSDQYKEIVAYYRAHVNEIEGGKISEYLELFPHRDRILSIIDTEVF